MTARSKIKLTVAKARDNFSEVLGRAAYGKERVVIHRHGKPFAAVVPLEDMALLEELEDRLDSRDFRAAREEARREGRIPWEDLKTALGL